MRCKIYIGTVPWTARRCKQSILKESSPEYLLERLMLKLKFQYFGHLMQRIDSLEKTLMLRKIEGRRRRGQQRMTLLDGITDSMDMSLSKQGSWWWIGKPGVLQSMGLQRVGHNWVTALKWTYIWMGFPGGVLVKCPPANTGDKGSIPRSGRFPEVGNGNPLQYSCLGNPMDSGAWWATVHGVAKSQTQLSTQALIDYIWIGMTVAEIIWRDLQSVVCQEFWVKAKFRMNVIMCFP